MEKMVENRSKNNILRYFAALKIYVNKWKVQILLFTCVFVFNAVLSFLIKYPNGMDEHGVLANAAFLSGQYDWSDCYSSSLPFYWGYGLSLLYIPFFYLSNSVDFIYSMCLLVNSAIIAFIPVFAYIIGLKVQKEPDKRKLFLLSLCIGIYPFFTVISKWTLNDTALIFICWLNALLLVILFDENISRKKEITIFTCLGFLSVYAYATHGRGLAILFSTFIMLGGYAILKKRKRLFCFSFLPTLIITWMIDSMIKSHIIGNMIQVQLEETGNTAQNVLKYIHPENLNLQNIINILTGASGQIYYATIASFGLICFFVVIFFYMLLGKRTKRFFATFRINYKFIIWYSVITLVLAFGISVGFMINTYASGGAPSWEMYIYGRYIETVFPLCIYLTLLFLISTKLDRKMLVSTICLLVIVIFIGIVQVMPEVLIRKDLGFGFGSVTTILAYAGKGFAQGSVSAYNFYQMSVITMSAFVFIIWLINMRKERIALCLLTLCFSYSAIYTIVNYFKPSNDSRLALITQLRDNLKDIYDLSYKYPNVYLSEENQRPIYIQYGLPDFDISYITPKVDQYYKLKDAKENSFIFSYTNEGFEKMFDGCYRLDGYEKPYVWIYGEELRKEVEKKGINTISVDQFSKRFTHNDIITNGNDYIEDGKRYYTSGTSIALTTMTMYRGQYRISVTGENVGVISSISVFYNGKRHMLSCQKVLSDYNEVVYEIEIPGVILDGELMIETTNELGDFLITDILFSGRTNKLSLKNADEMNKSVISIPTNNYQLNYRTRFTEECIGSMGQIWIKDGGYAFIRDVNLKSGIYEIELEGENLEYALLEIISSEEKEIIIEKGENGRYKIEVDEDIINSEIRIDANIDGVAYYKGMNIFKVF